MFTAFKEVVANPAIGGKTCNAGLLNVTPQDQTLCDARAAPRVGLFESALPRRCRRSSRTLGCPIACPRSLWGGDGNLYVGDVVNSVILQVTPSGAVTTVAGSSALPIATVLGGLPTKINSPKGLALLSKGSPVSLAVVDSFEHAFLRVDLP